MGMVHTLLFGNIWNLVCLGLLTILCVCERAAAWDGGTERVDSHPFVWRDEGAHPDLYDPDCGSGQPPEWAWHTHAADQGLHTRGWQLGWQVPTMHNSGFYDVQDYKIT